MAVVCERKQPLRVSLRFVRARRGPPLPGIWYITVPAHATRIQHGLSRLSERSPAEAPLQGDDVSAPYYERQRATAL